MPLPFTGLLLALALAGPVGEQTEQSPAASSDAAPPGEIVLGPAAEGSAVVVDEAGSVVAHVTLVPGRTTTIGLPPGRYRIESEGKRIAELELGPGQRLALPSPPSLAAEAPPDPQPIRPRRPISALPDGTTPAKTDPGAGRRAKRGRGDRRVLAPVLSTFVPGAGQFATRRPGRGMVYFGGTVGLTLGAVALYLSDDPSEGATRGDEGQTGAQEVVRLGGVALLSGAAALLYVGQILDAYGGAVGKTGRDVEPDVDHVLAFEVQRSVSVGFAPGQPEYRLYPDYSLAVMGQAAPRVTVGASDLSIKLEPQRSGVVVQGGVRSAYRFYDRRRLWLSAGGGVVLQGTSAQKQVATVDPADGDFAGEEGRFSAFMYGMLDARIFVLDHWALLIAPRISLPFGERRFGRERTVPRFSTTFELALGGAVHF